MTPRAAPWTRLRPTAGGGDAVLDFVAFGGPTLSPPGQLSDQRGWCPVEIDLTPQLWQATGEHLQAFWAQAIADRQWPTDRLDPALSAALGGTAVAVGVRFGVPDSDTLVGLQIAWAAMRWLVEGGCFAVLDVAADRWWSGDALQGWGDHRPLSVARELSVDEGTTDLGGERSLLWIVRGLAKFGRPDLVLQVPEGSSGPACRRMVMEVATQLVHGVVLSPGARLTIGGTALQVLPYRPGVLAVEPPLTQALVLLPAMPPG